MEANMGSFDDLLKTGLSSTAGGNQQHPGMSLATGILEMLTSQQTGGLQGLVQRFAQKGLGDIVSSWVSTGPNLAVSGGQIQSTLGSEAISSLAQRAGVAPDVASSLLAQVLPGIVDKLTPEGKIPESGNLLEQGLNILKGLKF
jgi:uncharacterized protein YidB (DUF937 family)